MPTLRPDKLVFGGQALAHDEDGNVVLLWNALPGEHIEVSQIMKRKGVKEAWADQVGEPSAHRIEPVEAHFGSCSPWQTMDFAYENEQKVAIGRETFQRIGGFDWPELAISAPAARFGYRNKIEFSFVEDEQGVVQLAFFGRGSKRKVPIPGCALAMPSINHVAQKLLQWIHTTDMTTRNLKSLIVRANKDGQVMAALLIKDKLNLELPPLDEGLVGLQLVYSTHKSPASVFTEVLQTKGCMMLTETVGGHLLSYGIESFFQVYGEAFEMALEAISVAVTGTRPLLDFYAGVGSIGLNLATQVSGVTLVESNAEAVEFATRNIAANKHGNVTVRCAPAEQIIDIIDAHHTLIVDPPRAGLHQDVVNRIMQVRPPTLIYLSCNLSTQARDLALLRSAYDLDSLRLYNLFPATPHIEGLAILTPKVV